MARTGDGISTLSRVVRILESFESERPELSVTEVARRSGLHVATASRLVAQLVGFGLLQRTERGIRIGVRLWELALRASPTLDLRNAALPFLEDLHAVIGHHAQLGIRDGREVLFVERLSAPNAVVNYTRVAGRLDLHASSSGQVLLAHAPTALQEEVLAGPLTAYTAHTVSTSRELRSVLADVRRQGYALCRGHLHPAATGVAVPVRDPAGVVVAALAVIVPNDDAAPGAVPALQATARGIARALAAPAVWSPGSGIVLDH